MNVVVCPEASVVVIIPCPSVVVIVFPELSVVVIVGGGLIITVEPALSVVVICPVGVTVPADPVPVLPVVEDTPPAGEPTVELGALLLMQLSSPDPIDMTSELPPVPRPVRMVRYQVQMREQKT